MPLFALMLALGCAPVKIARLLLLPRVITLPQQIEIQEKLGHTEHLPSQLSNLGVVKFPGSLAKESFEFVCFIKPRDSGLDFSGGYVLLHSPA